VDLLYSRFLELCRIVDKILTDIGLFTFIVFVPEHVLLTLYLEYDLTIIIIII